MRIDVDLAVYATWCTLLARPCTSSVRSAPTARDVLEPELLDPVTLSLAIDRVVYLTGQCRLRPYRAQARGTRGTRTGGILGAVDFYRQSPTLWGLW